MRSIEFPKGIETEERVREKSIEEIVKSDERIEIMIKHVRYLQLRVEAYEKDIQCLNNLIKKATIRVNNIKKFLIPFIVENSKFKIGEYAISITKYEEVKLAPDFQNFCSPLYKKKKEMVIIDEEAVIRDIKAGFNVLGAEIREGYDLKIDEIID